MGSRLGNRPIPPTLKATMTEPANGPSLEEFEQWISQRRADWENEIRSELVVKFSKLVGEHSTGDTFVRQMWRDVLPPSWPKSECDDYAATKAWCGGTLLFVYRALGIADGVHWKDGVGFVYPQHLPPTSNPKPGDVCYKNDPFRHYGMVAHEPTTSQLDGTRFRSIEANSTVRRADGSQGPLGIWHHEHQLTRAWTFFSILPLLERAARLSS